MPLTITYRDTLHRHTAQCDEIQAKTTIQLIKAYMLYPADFDHLEIDLSEEIERVTCTQSGDPVRRVCEFGGGSAWNIYRCIATIWPDINYHTTGRPAIIL